MKSNRYFLFSFFVLSLMLTACGGPDFSAEIKTIDSLQVEVDRVTKELGLLDSTRLDTISMNASNNVNLIKKVFNADTVNMDLARKITTYKSLRRVNIRARKQRGELWSEIAVSKKQLSDLRKALERGDFTPEEGKKYFQDEKLATRSLLGAYEEYKKNYESTVQMYDSLNPFVLEVINSK